MKFPDLTYEESLWKKGFNVIGIDEVGRGAFAGPVAVGGVIFPSTLNPSEREHLLSCGINDSKKLSAKKREELALQIKNIASSYSVSFIDVATINEIGIGKATFLGMRKVAAKLSKSLKNPYLLIDGFEIPGFDNPTLTKVLSGKQKGIIRGDCLSISIAAASIIAKVERDTLMLELSSKHPLYAWENNKGYGTLIHRRAISRYGITELHRKVFCRKIGAHLLF
ncbi:MAG: ribonuclease HII [Candidatus Levybacteria bacterium]|nr:ribonuclease HII [Candidatus Levybacteria bacterium]